jgi:acyl-CoA thioester hydrolase
VARRPCAGSLRLLTRFGPEKRPFGVRIAFHVQTYDIDFAGIVSNIVYIRWLEDLRLKLLEEHWPLDRALHDGYTPILLSTQVHYLRALKLFDAPSGTMWLSELGKARFALEAIFDLDGSLVARAAQTCAFVNSISLRPMRVPTGLREKYEREVLL